jgi:hypothetical protein
MRFVEASFQFFEEHPMTLFRPEVITAHRRRVFGSVTLHQPARLIALVR